MIVCRLISRKILRFPMTLSLICFFPDIFVDLNKLLFTSIFKRGFGGLNFHFSSPLLDNVYQILALTDVLSLNIKTDIFTVDWFSALFSSNRDL